MLLLFQRAGHLVHCRHHSVPGCKIPAREVLHQQRLHRSECKNLVLTTNSALQVPTSVAHSPIYVVRLLVLGFTRSAISQTTELKTGVRRHDVHYWVGEEAKEVSAPVILLHCMIASTMVPQVMCLLGS